MESNRPKILARLIRMAVIYELSVAVMTCGILYVLKLQDEALYFAVMGLHLPASIAVDPFVHLLLQKFTLPGNLTVSIALVHSILQLINISILSILFIYFEDKNRHLRE